LYRCLPRIWWATMLPQCEQLKWHRFKADKGGGVEGGWVTMVTANEKGLIKVLGFS